MFHASHGIKNYSEGVFKMGLDFSKAKPKAEETQTDTVVIPEQEIEGVTSYARLCQYAWQVRTWGLLLPQRRQK